LRLGVWETRDRDYQSGGNKTKVVGVLNG
jgi:hypothetical protein